MKLSITLPSIHPGALQRTLRNLHVSTKCEHEVIVVSPFRPSIDAYGEHVLWVKDHIMEGCNAGHALGLTKATGEFVFPWVDDHLMVDGWDVTAIAEFEGRESVVNNRPFALGIRQVTSRPQVGTCFGIYYPYFPLMHADDARRLGWYSGEYKVGFGDADLAFRVWDSGGLIEWSHYELIMVHMDDGRKSGPGYLPDDMRIFLERWAPVYGKTWGAGWKEFRDFNRDFDLCTAPTGAKTFSPDHRAF